MLKINNCTVFAEGSWYEVSHPETGVFSYGNYDPEMTENQIFKTLCDDTVRRFNESEQKFLTTNDAFYYNVCSELLGHMKLLGVDYKAYQGE